jgi:hypothetical protein
MHPISIMWMDRDLELLRPFLGTFFLRSSIVTVRTSHCIGDSKGASTGNWQGGTTDNTGMFVWTESFFEQNGMRALLTHFYYIYKKIITV